MSRLIQLARPMGAAIAVIVVAAVTGLTITTHRDRECWPSKCEPGRAGGLPAAAAATPPPSTSAQPSPARPPLPEITDPRVWASWALYDIAADTVTTGGKTGTNTTESLIKVAIAAQYIRELELSDRDPTLYERDALIRMIRDSDNEAAESLYRWRGGNQMLTKVLATCQLTESRTKAGWWSETQITAADGARLAECIADGRLCSPVWTEWILEQMRQVRGEGRFGIITPRPTDRGRTLAIKNGWTLRKDGWHVNCLAIADWWTMTILTRYPASYGLNYGARICADLAAALAPDNTKTAPTATPKVAAGAVPR